MTIDQKPTCALIHAGESYTGKQEFTYFAGVSSENCGAHGFERAGERGAAARFGCVALNYAMKKRALFEMVQN